VARRDRDNNPYVVNELVESEHRAGVDLAWIVAFAIALCVVAIAFTIPDRLLEWAETIQPLNVNGVIALLVVVPLGASTFAIRRYRDAVGAQRELTRLSLHDALTSLPNRRHLRAVLPAAFTHAWRNNTKAAVFFIDLDGFKGVNDTYGHEVGDQLMAAVGARLDHFCGEERWVARYAGDEFVIIDAAQPTSEHSRRFATEVVHLIEQPFELGEDRISISASVGLAFADVSSDPDEILSEADAAMYEAKHGASRTATYDESMRARLTPATAECRLQEALANGEFRLLYQPIVSLRSSRMVGVEALLRWDDPTRGMMTPGDFLPALEDTGLIVPVGRSVFRDVCRQARRWAEMTPAGETPLRVTTNVSPRQLLQVDYVENLAAALAEYGADPSQIYLEMTEASLISDPRATWATLEKARELGIGLAFDDFGTGFSSLTHLRSFDFELLKIDRSYLTTLGSAGKDDTIVRHVFSLARSLGIATVAEGISESSQVDLLLELGCELGQGFLFAEPQSATIIDNLVKQRGGRPVATTPHSPHHDGAVGATVLQPDLRTSPAR